MNRRHKRTTAGAHPHLYDAATQDIPRFKHKAPWLAPRYAPVIAALWLVTFIGAVLRFIQGIHVNHTDWHAVGDGVILAVCFVLTCLLWNAWEREERYPETLPKAEFERRYPPSSGAPPHTGETNETRPFHRQIPYTDDVTQTGTTLPEDGRCG